MIFPSPLLSIIRKRPTTMIKFSATLMFYILEQGSAIPGTRAKSGTPEGFAWHAKRFHAHAIFKI